jgi:hypothetical protein
MGIKCSDAGNLAIQTVHFILNVVELIDNGLIAVRAAFSERGGIISLHAETCHSGNYQKERDGSNRSQPTLVLIWGVPIHDLIRFQVQRSRRTHSHGLSTQFTGVVESISIQE